MHGPRRRARAPTTTHLIEHHSAQPRSRRARLLRLHRAPFALRLKLLLEDRLRLWKLLEDR